MGDVIQLREKRKKKSSKWRSELFQVKRPESPAGHWWLCSSLDHSVVLPPSPGTQLREGQSGTQVFYIPLCQQVMGTHPWVPHVACLVSHCSSVPLPLTPVIYFCLLEHVTLIGWIGPHFSQDGYTESQFPSGSVSQGSHYQIKVLAGTRFRPWCSCQGCRWVVFWLWGPLSTRLTCMKIT